MSTMPRMNYAGIFVGMFGVAGFITLLVYYIHKCYSRLNCVKRRRILPTILDDTENGIEIEIPRVTFQVDATEIAYSDDEDAYLEEIPSESILNISNLRTPFAIAKESEKSQIYVEPYRNNEVRKYVVVDLPAEIIDIQENIVPITIAKQVV